jgi:hypothetical protein
VVKTTATPRIINLKIMVEAFLLYITMYMYSVFPPHVRLQRRRSWKFGHFLVVFAPPSRPKGAGTMKFTIFVPLHPQMV